MEYLSQIISFIVGGGLTTIINMRLSSRSQKVDFADKAIAFMDGQNDSLMKRICALEEDVKRLSEFKCERPNCITRIPQP